MYGKIKEYFDLRSTDVLLSFFQSDDVRPELTIRDRIDSALFSGALIPGISGGDAMRQLNKPDAKGFPVLAYAVAGNISDERYSFLLEHLKTLHPKPIYASLSWSLLAIAVAYNLNLPRLKQLLQLHRPSNLELQEALFVASYYGRTAMFDAIIKMINKRRADEGLQALTQENISTLKDSADKNIVEVATRGNQHQMVEHLRLKYRIVFTAEQPVPEPLLPIPPVENNISRDVVVGEIITQRIPSGQQQVSNDSSPLQQAVMQGNVALLKALASGVESPIHYNELMDVLIKSSFKEDMFAYLLDHCEKNNENLTLWIRKAVEAGKTSIAERLVLELSYAADLTELQDLGIISDLITQKEEFHLWLTEGRKAVLDYIGEYIRRPTKWQSLRDPRLLRQLEKEDGVENNTYDSSSSTDPEKEERISICKEQLDELFYRSHYQELQRIYKGISDDAEKRTFFRHIRYNRKTLLSKIKANNPDDLIVFKQLLWTEIEKSLLLKKQRIADIVYAEESKSPNNPPILSSEILPEMTESEDETHLLQAIVERMSGYFKRYHQSKNRFFRQPLKNVLESLADGVFKDTGRREEFIRYYKSINNETIPAHKTKINYLLDSIQYNEEDILAMYELAMHAKQGPHSEFATHVLRYVHSYWFPSKMSAEAPHVVHQASIHGLFASEGSRIGERAPALVAGRTAEELLNERIYQDKTAKVDHAMTIFKSAFVHYLAKTYELFDLLWREEVQSNKERALTQASAILKNIQLTTSVSVPFVGSIAVNIPSVVAGIIDMYVAVDSYLDKQSMKQFCAVFPINATLRFNAITLAALKLSVELSPELSQMEDAPITVLAEMVVKRIIHFIKSSPSNAYAKYPGFMERGSNAMLHLIRYRPRLTPIERKDLTTICQEGMRTPMGSSECYDIGNKVGDEDSPTYHQILDWSGQIVVQEDGTLGFIPPDHGGTSFCMAQTIRSRRVAGRESLPRRLQDIVDVCAEVYQSEMNNDDPVIPGNIFSYRRQQQTTEMNFKVGGL